MIGVSYVHCYAILDYYTQKGALLLRTFGTELDVEGVSFDSDRRFERARDAPNRFVFGANAMYALGDIIRK